MTEKKLKNKMNLQYAGDNLPRLIEKIIVGMPMRFSGDEKQLLEIALECIQTEISRRDKLGRNKTWNSTKEKNAHFNAKRRGKLKNTLQNS